MVLWVAASVVLLALAAPLLALQYLTRLPEAPACPACRATTTEAASRPEPSGADRAWALVAATRRRCAACGWEGRMRWRWAAEQAGREGRGR